MAQILNPLAAHIHTVKRRLIIIGATILVALMGAFAFSADMIAWLNRPFPNQLVFYGPTEALFASIKVSFLAAVVCSLPVVFYQFWKFIAPALLPREQRWGIPLFARSEEHTSELQSPTKLVCRLLLEKKKSRVSTAFPPAIIAIPSSHPGPIS